MIRTALIGPSENAEVYKGIIRQCEGYVTGGSDTTARERLTGHFVPAADWLDSTDALVFTSREDQSFEVIRDALKYGRHVLMYPDPILPFHQTDHLRRIAEEAGVLLYVAHHFHDKSLLDIFQEHCPHPEYLNISRHCVGKIPCNENNIRECLYFEIISLLALNRFPLRKYTFISVPFYSPDPSLIVVRLEFTNGSAASLTLNQFSGQHSRTIELFSADTMVSSGTGEDVVRIMKNKPMRTMEVPTSQDGLYEINLIEDMMHFFQLIRKKSFPADHYISGIMAHKIAAEITRKLSPETASRPQ